MSHIIFNVTRNEYMNSFDNLIGALELSILALNIIVKIIGR